MGRRAGEAYLRWRSWSKPSTGCTSSEDITATISDADVSILSARVDTIEDRTALSRFAFRAASSEHVQEVIRARSGASPTSTTCAGSPETAHR